MCATRHPSWCPILTPGTAAVLRAPGRERRWDKTTARDFRNPEHLIRRGDIELVEQRLDSGDPGDILTPLTPRRYLANPRRRYRNEGGDYGIIHHSPSSRVRNASPR